MKESRVWWRFLLVAIFVYLFFLQVQAIWPFTIDDMYISLRYARHWATGNGLLWNLNEAPVEGYSNFSFVVLGALSILLHLDPVIVLKMVGALGLLMAFFGVYCLSRFWFDSITAWLPALTLLVYKGQMMWAVSGLETTFFQALVCGAVYTALRGMGYAAYPQKRSQPHKIYFILSGVFMVIAGMTRPETPALIVLFLMLMVWDRPLQHKKEYNRGVVYYCLIVLVLYGPYFIWHWHYYGRLFPNPVYCKGLYSKTSVDLDVNYIKLILPLLVPVVFASWCSEDKRHFFLWMPSVLYLLLLFHSDPIVAFENRLFLPVFLLLLPLAFYGVSLFLLYFFKKKDVCFFSALYWVWVLMVVLCMPWMTLSEYRFFSQNPVRGEQLRQEVVDWLSVHARSDDHVVLADCGKIPYLSHLNYIDSYCLNNASMTLSSSGDRYERFCVDVLKKQPRFILLTSFIENGRVIYTPSDKCLKRNLINQKKYSLVHVFSLKDNESIYQYEMFAK